VNNAGYVLGIEHVGDIADADIEGMFATNGELFVQMVLRCNSISLVV
jgi:NADP-dependent 3-hydroxy acid dehydrogenase YdfG